MLHINDKYLLLLKDLPGAKAIEVIDSKGNMWREYHLFDTSSLSFLLVKKHPTAPFVQWTTSTLAYDSLNQSRDSKGMIRVL